MDLAEEIIRKIQEEMESGTCQDLTSTWNELWDEDERAKRKQILAEECRIEIREFLEEILLKEQKTRNDYIERVEKLLAEINELQTSLELKIPYEDVEKLPLHDMAFRLNKKAEKYRLIRDDRVNQLNELTRKEALLCEKLGTVPNKITISDIPTITELKQIENHVAAMEQEKIDRTFTFLEQRQVICGLYRELGIKPILNFEKEILSSEVVQSFKVTNENMKRVAELKAGLETQLEDAKQSVVELRDKLMLLWKYLDEDEEHSKNFLDEHEGHSVAVINALKEELRRCEIKKREDICKIVGRIRQVLVEEWDRCLISEEERNKFRPFHIDCFTEDLCDLHELEIERLKSFYQKNEKIFELISKHGELFKKLLALEKGSKNANRYYNRGGQLLQEERERRIITKELPIVEEELRNRLKLFEADEGRPFTSNGIPLDTILDEQWAAHFDQKTIEKLARRQGPEKKGRTPLGKRICTTPGSSVATKVSRLNFDRLVSSNNKCLITKSQPRSNVTQRRKKFEVEEPDNTFLLEPTYDDFQVR